MMKVREADRASRGGKGTSKMSERGALPLAVAIMGMSLAVISYAIKDESIGLVVYGSGLLSAAFAILHWFSAPVAKRR